MAGEGPETRLGSLGSGGMTPRGGEWELTPRGGEREFSQAANKPRERGGRRRSWLTGTEWVPLGCRSAVSVPSERGFGASRGGYRGEGDCMLCFGRAKTVVRPGLLRRALAAEGGPMNSMVVSGGVGEFCG